MAAFSLISGFLCSVYVHAYAPRLMFSIVNAIFQPEPHMSCVHIFSMFARTLDPCSLLRLVLPFLFSF